MLPGLTCHWTRTPTEEPAARAPAFAGQLNVRHQNRERQTLGEMVLFILATAFVAWIVYFGGAEWLEGTITSAFVIDPSAPLWSAAGIKLYTVVTWIVALLSWLFFR